MLKSPAALATLPSHPLDLGSPAKSKDRPASKRATQAERSQEARTRIVEAAFACLAEMGYQRTTLGEIAKRANCSRELPRYHFGTKDLLMEALVDETQGHWRGLFEKQQMNNATALEALYQTADWIGAEIKEKPATVRGFAVLVFGAADPTNSALYKKIRVSQSRTREFFRTIIAKQHQDRPGGAAVDVSAKAALVYSMFRGIGYQWLIDPDSVPIDALLDEFKQLCPTLLHLKPATSGPS